MGNNINTRKYLGRKIFGIAPPIITAYDSDFQLVIDAIQSTGVTLTTTQKNAGNQLVIDCKNNGAWTNSLAFYGILGGTAGAHKWNWKNPADTDAGFRLTFSTGFTHTNNGIIPNGTSAYANTNFISNGNLTLYNSHLSYYSRTSGNPASNQSFMGNNSNTAVFNNKAQWFLTYTNTGGLVGTQHSSASITDYANAIGQTSRAGFWMNNRTSLVSTTLKVWKNGIALANATTTPGGEALNTSSTYLCARRNTTTSSPFAESYTNAECAFASIGNGLTDTQALNFYNAVQTYQTALGRQV